jgi:hypothetical protein
VGGIWLGLLAGKERLAQNDAARQGTGTEQDALVSGSAGRAVSGSRSQVVASENARGSEKQGEATVAQTAAAQAQAAAVQQQAALQATQRELDVKAAEQAAKEKALQDEQARIELDKQRAANAVDEAERQRAAMDAERAQQQAAEQLAKARRYDGPSSGELVWRGEVRGTSLVTIEGNSSDTGQVVSGALPGVLVMVQPVDAKHVGVAGAPAPSNGFRRLVLRVQGNGPVQEVIHWSVP